MRKPIGVRSATCFLVIIGLVLALSYSVWAGAQIRTEAKAVSYEWDDLQYLEELRVVIPILQTTVTEVGILFSVLEDDPMLPYDKVRVEVFIQHLDVLWRGTEYALKIKPTPKYKTVQSYLVKSMVEIQATIAGLRRLLINKDSTAIENTYSHLDQALLYQKSVLEELVKANGK